MKPKLEVVPHFLNDSLVIQQYNENNFETPWHYHNEFELTYIIRSNGVRYTGSSIENFKAGDLVLLGANLPHCWQNAPNYNLGATSLYVQWRPDIFNGIFKINEFQNIRSMLEKAKYGINFEASNSVKKIGEDLVNLLTLNRTERIISFINILHQISGLSDYKLLSQANSPLLYSNNDNRINDIFEFIDKNYDRKISVKKMSELTYMTQSSFCKYFKKQFNKTFTQYLNEFRIYNVCQQLQENNQSISEIALSCGYENMSYFHRQFLKIIHLTPAQYRSKYLTF